MVTMIGRATSPGQAGERCSTGAYGGEEWEEGGTDLTFKIYEATNINGNIYQLKSFSYSMRQLRVKEEQT